MQRKLMWVEFQDGAHLSESRKGPGDFSPLTRDGDNNLGHVTLSDADEVDFSYDAGHEPEPDPATELVAALMLLGVVVAVQKAAPHVQRWWNESAVPFARRARRRLPRQRRASPEVLASDTPATAPFTLVATVPSSESDDVFVALDDYRASMSSAEARDRFVAALVARLFADEQLRVLRNARIEDDGSGLKLVTAVEALTPRQLGESLRRLLEAHPTWPDDQTVAELERVLERSREQREVVPAAQTSWVRRALRLPPIER